MPTVINYPTLLHLCNNLLFEQLRKLRNTCIDGIPCYLTSIVHSIIICFIMFFRFRTLEYQSSFVFVVFINVSLLFFWHRLAVVIHYSNINVSFPTKLRIH